MCAVANVERCEMERTRDDVSVEQTVGQCGFGMTAPILNRVQLPVDATHDDIEPDGAAWPHLAIGEVGEVAQADELRFSHER